MQNWLFGGCGAQLLETPFTKTKDENISTADLISMTETISQDESADERTLPFWLHVIKNSK